MVRSRYWIIPLVILVILVVLESNSVSAIEDGHVNSEAPSDKTWGAEWKRRIESDDLYRFAVSEFGEPTSSSARESIRFEGKRYGLLSLEFGDMATFQVRTWPSEASDVSLTVTGGFSNPKEALSALTQYASSLGFEIEWGDKPHCQQQSDVKICEFWERDTGGNAKAYRGYKGEVLVTIGVSYSL